MHFLELIFCGLTLICGLKLTTAVPMFDNSLYYRPESLKEIVLEVPNQVSDDLSITAKKMDVFLDRGIEKRRWLFPKQKASLASLYSMSECPEDLGGVMATLRSLPRGKQRDALFAAIYGFCGTGSNGSKRGL